jgi:hypothetical protein
VTGIAPADLPQQNLRLQFADRVNLNPRFSYWLEKLIDPAIEQRFSSARQALEALIAAVNPEASTNQQSISPVAVLSVLPVLIAVVAGGISVYFPIANYLTSQQSEENQKIESLHQKIKANELKAKIYLDAINRAQQDYYLGYNKFANSLEELGLDIKT